MGRRGGQVSVEYLMVLGVAFLVLIPGSYLFYTFSQGSNDRVMGSQITRAGQEFVNTVEMVYGVGGNSWDTVVLNLPETTTDMYVSNGREVVIEYDTSYGMTQAVFFSNINITTPYPGGNLTPYFRPGLTSLKISSYGYEVSVEESLQ